MSEMWPAAASLESVMNFAQQRGSAMEFQASEGDVVQPLQARSEPLVVPHEAAEARLPGKGAFHDPAPGQQHKAVLGLRQLDDLQPDALRCRVCGRFGY